ncbi:MAG: GNAT family N-acetyltransferase [Robiginitomaculum sp.]|nr:GNAT family N-acetyltransferase [Robiginitomaculum sp.]
MPLQIETSRLSLAPFDPSDINRFVDLANDRQIAKMVMSLPHPYTNKHARNWLAQQQSDNDNTDLHENLYLFAIKDSDSGFIGMISLNRVNNAIFELGYWIGRDFWGKGFASEATKAVLQWAEEQLGIKAICAGYFADNPASARVLEKSGFLRTGVKTTRYSKGRGENVSSIDMVWLGET